MGGMYFGSPRRQFVLFGGAGGYSNEVDVYDVTTNRWTIYNANGTWPGFTHTNTLDDSNATLSGARYRHMVSYLNNDEAIIAGGSDGFAFLDIWKLILNNMTWIRLPTTIPYATTTSAKQIIGGFLYIFGGKTLLNDGLNVTGGSGTLTATPVLSPIQIYDMNNNQWITACPVSQCFTL